MFTKSSVRKERFLKFRSLANFFFSQPSMLQMSFYTQKLENMIGTSSPVVNFTTATPAASKVSYDDAETTTVNKDRPSIHYLFLNPANDSTLTFIFVLFKHTFYRENCRFQQDSNSDCLSRRRARLPPPRPKAVSIFVIVIKKHLKWGDEVMKRVSPIIQCSMDDVFHTNERRRPKLFDKHVDSPLAATKLL